MSFCNIFSYTTTPPSTKVKEDFLLSFASLEKIKSQLKTYQSGDKELSDICRDLVNLTKIYNENVRYINNEVATYKPFAFPSFETYCKGKYAIPSKLKLDYEGEKLAFETEDAKKTHELIQLKQTGCLCDLLSQKITRVFAKLSKFESIAQQIPPYELLKINLAGFDASPRLRISETASITRSIVMTSVQTPKISTSNIDVTIVCTLDSDQILGICCEPDWTPIAFTKNEKGWSGQVPVSKDWKCVILQNNQVHKWENGDNRRCDAQKQTLSLDVTFA